LEDSGTFSCIATNAFGKAKSTTNLIVDKPKESGPPNFTKTLKDVRTMVGNNVNFEVELTSTEPVQVQWTKVRYYPDKVTIFQRRNLSRT